MVVAKSKSAGSRAVYFDPRDIEIVTGVLGKKDTRFNPRTLSNPGFSNDNMDSLRRGIAKDGLNHALLIRIDPVTNKPKLVAGERRLRAICLLVERDQEAERKIKAGDKNAKRILVKNQKNGKMETAVSVYLDQGVECKITDETDEKEFLRQAIQENTLHESLTDYELLLQCRQMEDAGFTRSDQADTMDMSEAWISQSHGLLNGPACVLTAMERGQLTRTAALTFLAIPNEKVEEVLKRAIDITYREAEQKEAQAQGDLEKAMDEIQRNEGTLRLSQYTGDGAAERKARRQINRAGKARTAAEKKILTAKQKKKKKIPVEIINKAAQQVDGAAENLNKPQSMKHARLISTQIKSLLESTKEDVLVRPDSKQQYSKRDVCVVLNVIEWFLNQNHCKHPLDAILIADEDIDSV